MPCGSANRLGPGRPRAGSGQLARKPLQGRLVPDEPQVAERVDEASLPVNAPWRLMVADLVDAAVRAGCHGAFDESVRVVGEDLDSHGPGAGRGRGVPAVVLGLTHEDRGAGDAQPGDAAEVPQFRRAEGTLVPVNGDRCVLDREHERYASPVSSQALPGRRARVS